jgi:hypothetical protein
VRPEQAAERRTRHFRWLLKDGNNQRLMEEGLRLYREGGRGFWLVSHHRTVELDANDAITEVSYLLAADLTALPGGRETKRELAKLVARYDPRTQYVICFEEPDGRSTYRIGGG